MKILMSLSLILASFSLAVSPASSRAAPHVQLMTSADRHVAFTASRVSVHSRTRALHWLRKQESVERATLGLDHMTIEVLFRDGSSVVLLPSVQSEYHVSRHALQVRMASHPHAAADSPARAAVLEPFADDLNLGTNAGQAVADLLTTADFKVDVFRNAEVTVPVMEQLSNYSVVYMLTHSGVLDNGHAMILLGETNPHPYDSLFKECSQEMPPVCSVMQGIAQGTNKLSIAVTDLLVLKHISAFPDNSVMFLNGCEIMSAPAFVSAWHHQNVASLVGWDGKVDSAITEQSASSFFGDMATGKTVTSTLSDLASKNLAASVWNGQVTYLKQDGNGDDTLSMAIAGAAPHPSPTATATDTPPTPTVSPVPTRAPSKACPKNASKKHGKCVCKKGYTMKHGKCVKKKK